MTLQTCHQYHQLAGVKKRKFASLFGRLALRYSRGRVYITLGNVKWAAKYDIVAQDSDSIVLRIHSEDIWKRADPAMTDILKQASEPRLQHIQFRTLSGHKYYWVGFGAFCEWFKRVDV